MAETQAVTNAIIGSYDKVHGGIDVNVQSQTNAKFQYFLIREEKTDITLTAPVAVGDTTINVSAGHGFTTTATLPGAKIVLFDGEFYTQSDIKTVNVNVITLFDPITAPFSVATTKVIRGNAELRFDNTGGVDYKWNPAGRGPTIPIDINKMILSFECGATAPDLGTFGAATALTNKIYIRKTGGAIPTHLGVYGKNRDFEDYGSEVRFTEKAPGGTHGVIITIDIENVFKSIERVFQATEAIVLTAQDNLVVTGINSLTVSLIGSYTFGEI